MPDSTFKKQSNVSDENSDHTFDAIIVGAGSAGLAALREVRKRTENFLIVNAGPFLAKQGVVDRVDLVEGSFFESVPPGADAYVLKSVIHDWNDEQSVDILRKVRAAAERVTQALATGRIAAVDGTELPLRFDSVCVHSDAPGAPAVACAVREAINAHTAATTS